MKNWEMLYKEKGIIQKEPSKFVKAAVEFFKQENLEKILDLGCGTGRHTGEEIELNTKINIDAIDGKVPYHYFTESEIKELFNKFEIIKLEHVKFKSERGSTKNAAAFIMYARKK